MRQFNLTPLPAFNDNYLWLLDDGRDALVVDPGDAQPVLHALRQRGLRLAGILVTHHHGDHTGGVAQLREATSAQVWGPSQEVQGSIPQPYTPLRGSSSITALGLDWQVISVPGHTAGHIAYFCPAVALGALPVPGQLSKPGAPAHGPGGSAPVLFCGDTLFCAGCGRIFEGTPAQMLASLDTLAALPGNTLVCAAHEYTLSNLKFAQAVEPGNANVIDHRAHCQALRANNQPTLPSTIALERAINPFLRARESSVVQTVQAHAGLNNTASATDTVGVFAALREWKNNFS